MGVTDFKHVLYLLRTWLWDLLNKLTVIKSMNDVIQDTVLDYIITWELTAASKVLDISNSSLGDSPALLWISSGSQMCHLTDTM